jgi:hypothetical protein
VESWEIIASITAFVAILISAIIIHSLNKWRRWGIVESDSLRRITTSIPASEIPALEIVRYEYVHGQEPISAPLIVLLAPQNRYLRILDQYATGLCLAEFPVIILKWKKAHKVVGTNFANIAAKVETLPNIPASGIVYFVYRTVTREIVPRVACAAKNPNNRWILVSPEILDAGKCEIFAGNGAKIHVIYSRDSPKRMKTGIEALKTQLNIPDQNIAPFPLGGPNLTGQETVALGKIISWLSIRG